jgi:hypothetical protein
MKKRMILVALLAMPLGTLLACHKCEETKVRSNCGLCNFGCNSCKTRSYDRESDMMQYDTMENTPVEEYLEVPYREQVVEETIGEEPMYEQQVVEESVEEGAAITGLTAEQRAQHAALMNEVKATGTKKPSQIAGAKKTTTPKKATTTKKTTAAKKPAKAKTTRAKKTTTPKKTTTNGKKVAKNKKTEKHARGTKHKATKTGNVVA